MKTLGWLVSLTLGSIGVVSVNFDAGAPGKMPLGWTRCQRLTLERLAALGDSEKDPSAPSPPNVLAQVSHDSNESSAARLAILEQGDRGRDGDLEREDQVRVCGK